MSCFMRASSYVAAFLCSLPIASSVMESQIIAQETATQVITCDHKLLLFAPYVWKRSGIGIEARADATMPGAYLRARVTGTKSISLLIDGTANFGCPVSSQPVVEFSIDEGPFQSKQLRPTDSIYALTLAADLDPRMPHRVEVYFSAADLSVARWRVPTAHLHLAGLQIDAGSQLLPSTRRRRHAIGFGDSITEGVGVNGLFTSWQQLNVNNARTTWLPIVAATLDCEYGQLGTGGQGMVIAHDMPPLGG